jgi:hypothetical protein
MTNLAADRETEFVEEIHRDYVPVAAATKICNGAAVALNLLGLAVSAGPGNVHFRGIAEETVDNTADALGGALSIPIIMPEAAYFDGAGFAQSDLGQPVYFSDDHTVTKTAGTNTYAGRIREVASATQVLVDLRGAYLDPKPWFSASPSGSPSPSPSGSPSPSFSASSSPSPSPSAAPTTTAH